MSVSEDNINPHLTESLRIVVFLLYGMLGASDIRHHMLPIERRLGACNAVFFSVLDVIRDLRCLQECLGRHTSRPEAVATDTVLLHKRGLFTQFAPATASTSPALPPPIIVKSYVSTVFPSGLSCLPLLAQYSARQLSRHVTIFNNCNAVDEHPVYTDRGLYWVGPCRPVCDSLWIEDNNIRGKP